jgi:Purple acid Phosphatase, N-terminal domain
MAVDLGFIVFNHPELINVLRGVKMNKVLLTLSIMLLSGSLRAQVSPTTPKAARVQISQGPEIELASEYLTIIRWTVNNPGGSPVHYGVVRYGSNAKALSQTAKNPIRLNPSHSSTVFRVRLDDLKPRTTYYYTVDSMEANGRSDGVASPINNFRTP